MRSYKVSSFQLLGVVGTIACITLFMHEPSFPTPDKILVFASFVCLIFKQAAEMLKRFVPFVGLLFVFDLFKKSRWKYLSLSYPIFIYFGTVYQGEHYAIDEILGGVYAVGAFYAAPYVMRVFGRTWHRTKRHAVYQKVAAKLQFLPA